MKARGRDLVSARHVGDRRRSICHCETQRLKDQQSHQFTLAPRGDCRKRSIASRAGASTLPQSAARHAKPDQAAPPEAAEASC
jgi:hypothetical protein